ncbi:MAG: hypothetical protein LBM38_06560 [Clostridiales bacterium]|jgi:hypothetical protein|nr:hypothetical protein [Clostridiales bacterium]
MNNSKLNQNKKKLARDAMFYAQGFLSTFYERMSYKADNSYLGNAFNNKLNIYDKYGKRVENYENAEEGYALFVLSTLLKKDVTELLKIDGFNASNESKDLLVKWICYDDEACDFCKSNNSRIFRLEDLPVTHPNCRCGLELSDEIKCSPMYLEENLEESFSKDQGLIEKIAHFVNSPSYTTNTILKYDDVITKNSIKYGVEKSLIQAILYQEIRCVYFMDFAADFVGRAESRLNFKDFLGKKLGNVSTGIGQIQPKTAIIALNLTNKNSAERIFDDKNVDDLADMYFLLQDDEFNIEVIARNLSAIQDGKIPNYEFIKDIKSRDEKMKAILARYNGLGDDALAYGEKLYGISNVFSAYENCGR